VRVGVLTFINKYSSPTKGKKEVRFLLSDNKIDPVTTGSKMLSYRLTSTK
jgi:hypothetical protein